MSGPVSLQRQGEVAVLTVDNPPVNALARAVLEGLVLVGQVRSFPLIEPTQV